MTADIPTFYSEPARNRQRLAIDITGFAAAEMLDSDMMSDLTWREWMGLSGTCKH